MVRWGGALGWCIGVGYWGNEDIGLITLYPEINRNISNFIDVFE